MEPIPVVGELAKSLNAAGDAAKSNALEAGPSKVPETAPSASAVGLVDPSDPKQLLASTNFYRSLADKQGPIADSLRGRSPEELEQLALQGVPQTADGVVNFATGIPPAAPGTRQEYDRQQAIKQMFAGSRDLPADFEMLARNLPPTERAKLTQLFEDNKPGDLTKSGGSIYWMEKGDNLLKSAADWSDRTFGGPRPDDKSFSANLQRSWRTAVETLPSGTATFLEHVGTTLDSLSGSTATSPLIGETAEQTRARLYPVAADVEALGESYAERYGPVIKNGDFSKLKSDYYNDPVGTFLQDVQPVLLASPIGKSVLGKTAGGLRRTIEGAGPDVGALAGRRSSHPGQSTEGTAEQLGVGRTQTRPGGQTGAGVDTLGRNAASERESTAAGDASQAPVSLAPLKRNISEGSSRGSVPLFRNVEGFEFDSIANNGQFLSGGTSLEGKWFATSGSDAEVWGRKLNKGQGLTVTTDVPRSFLDQVHYHSDKLDGVGPAYYVDEAQLPLLNELMNGIRLWPW